MRIRGIVILSLLVLGAGVALLRARFSPEARPGGAEPVAPNATTVESEPVDAKTSAATAAAAVDVADDPRLWQTQYRDAPDYYAFAERAAAAAAAGDARAQYFLAQTLLDCQLQVSSLAAGQGSLEQRMEAFMATSPGLQQEPYRRTFVRRVERCRKFFDEGALESLFPSEEQRAFRYWLDQALANGDPLAVIDRAFKLAVQVEASSPPERRREVEVAILPDVQVAVASRDPAALFKVGALYAQSSWMADEYDGMAWWVAACELGYDCSMANLMSSTGCVDGGTCDGGLTLQDTLQRDLGSARYAAIYAMSQDIAYKVTNGDWDGLQQYLH